MSCVFVLFIVLLKSLARVSVGEKYQNETFKVHVLSFWSAVQRYCVYLHLGGSAQARQWHIYSMRYDLTGGVSK